ncbi:helix-turn-helix transcriptional regulator [Ichthyenterobacterium sp. W332]|uniref:Helix-turn-helix transcriptional regulator n=1 Tax=Microcosmobacter mediterraneus TaxID=3075607 RepID=A0ABU2YLD8_9FLAO|nr:helix-turn-helix transcriptional regulator [Ichthyenterobacterium sp. W332]MDT0558716.1 helix-turn-helix transcriptional regulator [Ichthyenterobacterium sp. W332]
MINTEDFIKRLQKVIDFYGESASSFAEKIGVQRSSISHILSGRNKPSLDFVMKVLSSYPEVELYWLMNGKGHFPSQPKHDTIQKPQLKSSQPKLSQIKTSKPLSSDKAIERIVIFYSDGSFRSFES